MSKKNEFINYLETVINVDEMNEDAKSYWFAFKTKEETEKAPFTDNGKLILQFLKEHQETANWKAKDIAEELFVSSRMVSGAIRKLVTEGYVEKLGETPVIYSITEKGKNVEII
jgi:DNA-binding MarR family transcriptional regulator